jgi:hypothetical protein
MNSTLDATRSKIEHAMQRVRALRSHAAAQGDIDIALSQVYKTLSAHRNNLNTLAATESNEELVAVHCRIVLSELYEYVSSLGFLHRAQHPCNPFEAYDPLRRLAQAVIGEDTRIVISSEWDFSPLTYVSVHGLPEFVFIGLPASESDNAFLLPLAGHEFGHSLWRRHDAGVTFEDQILSELILQIRSRWADFTAAFPQVKDESTLTSLPASVEAWRPAWRIAKRQCEEIYCDLVGLRVFGDSYLHAFDWLIAPGLDATRGYYPTGRTRASVLVEASTSWSVAVPPGFAERFLDGPKTVPLTISLADATTAALTKALMNDVVERLSTKGIALPRTELVEQISARLQQTVPAVLPSTLPELLCGAWSLRRMPNLWSSYPHLAKDKERILNELVLKSAQCLEWRTRLEGAQ